MAAARRGRSVGAPRSIEEGHLIPSTAPPPQSGTKDKTYDLITVTHLCLEHVWRLEQYAADAERDGDAELGDLFRRMQDHSRRGAEECKAMLTQRLTADHAR